MNRIIRKQRGAAAIFIVVFFALLISVIALSFLHIAIQDQEQATNNDLSQSAYNSANAGVEDAKRAISWYNVHCLLATGPSPTDAPNCAVYNTAFTNPNNQCNITDLIATGTLPGTHVTSGTEVQVSSNAGDQKLDQAYTCTTITTQTKDVKAVASNGKNDLIIPLRTVGAQPFDTIELSWFTNDDSPDHDPTFPVCSAALPQCLPQPAGWLSSTPPIMRFELIPVLRDSVNGFSITQIDKDTKTVFLYPSLSALATPLNLAHEDQGRSIQKMGEPQPTKCQPTFSGSEYACTAQIQGLPDLTPANTDYYLRLTPIYNNAHYQIQLFDGGGATLRLFDNVEPQIDSTGRANNVFRRVQAGVISKTSSNPLADGGFDITQGICKDFNIPAFNNNCPPTSPSLVTP